MESNPLFAPNNKAINFDILKAEDVMVAVDAVIEKATDVLAKIYHSVEKPTFENTLLSLDRVHNDIEKVLGPIYLLAYTHPEEETRKLSMVGIQKVEAFFNDLMLDAQLYASIKAYAETPQATALTGTRKKYFAESLQEFERNGMGLPKEKQEKLRALRNKLSEQGIAFDTNIAGYHDELILPESDLEGLPEDYKKARRQENGTYNIDLQSPSYRPFMKYAVSDRARKQLYVKYMNKASESNKEVLLEILKLRQEIATLLGYRSYAEYNTEMRMAKNPPTIWGFEKQLETSVKEKAAHDYAELLAIISAQTNKHSKNIASWQSAYFGNKLLEEKYKVDDNLIKEYFVLDHVIEGMFAVAAQLYNVSFTETNEPVWHSDVRAFEMYLDGKLKGRFYLDLFPRKNKYQHAASFPMNGGKMIGDTYQIPQNTLVCNFPAATADKPSLLPHNDVVTFFHEFGHLLHSLTTVVELRGQSGTNVARDFVETPSQLFENWAWEYDSLKLFAKHYQTGDILPLELQQKMLAAKNVGSGLHVLQQILYGTLDMTLHDKFDPESNQPIAEIVEELQNRITPFKYVKGTSFETGFGHLNGYAAGYYGYLWALVYADDIFSVFRKEGIMSRETGLRYRDLILSQGSAVDEMEQVEAFLMRKPSQDAFLKSLGL